jgi:hypothetical protein
MVSGLLMELDDHNCQTIAAAVGYRGSHRLQHLLSRAVWDDQQMLHIAAAWAVSHLDDGDGVLIVDETAGEKPPADAVGTKGICMTPASETWLRKLPTQQPHKKRVRQLHHRQPFPLRQFGLGLERIMTA